MIMPAACVKGKPESKIIILPQRMDGKYLKKQIG
jgi:hypothetical protein